MSVQAGGKAGQSQQLEELRETINKVPELTRLRKIFAKDRGTMEEPLRLPTGDLTRTPGDILGALVESHFLGARINRVPERSLNSTKTGANSIDWHMIRKVVTEDRVRWAVNTFTPYEVPGCCERTCNNRETQTDEEINVIPHAVLHCVFWNMLKRLRSCKKEQGGHIQHL